MFLRGIPSIFVPGDSVFMLLKCICNNTSIEEKDIISSLEMCQTACFKYFRNLRSGQWT